MKWMGLVLALGTICQAGTDLLGHAPVAASAAANPYEGDETAARAGAKLVERECQPCHGERSAGKAPLLNSSPIRDAPAGALFWVLRNGSLYRGMPSFAHLPEAQRWQIVEYLKRNR